MNHPVATINTATVCACGASPSATGDGIRNWSLVHVLKYRTKNQGAIGFPAGWNLKVQCWRFRTVTDLTTAVCDTCLADVRKTRPARAGNRRMFLFSLLSVVILSALTGLCFWGVEHCGVLGVLGFATGLFSILSLFMMLITGFKSLFGSHTADVHAYHMQQAAKAASAFLSLPAVRIFSFIRATAVRRQLPDRAQKEGEWFIVDGGYNPSASDKSDGSPGTWDDFRCTKSSWGQSDKRLTAREAASELGVKSLWEFVDGRG